MERVVDHHTEAMKTLDLVSRHPAAESIWDRVVLATARVALALVFIYSGFGKLTGFSGFTTYLSSLNVPQPALFTLISIVVELGFGICLAIGYRARLAAWALAAFTVAATVIGHQFWEGGAAADANLLHAMKNTAILGGLMGVSVAESAVALIRRG